jgi:hypothetical protein
VEQAEFIAFLIGEHVPAHLHLPDLDFDGAEPH